MCCSAAAAGTASAVAVAASVAVVEADGVYLAVCEVLGDSEEGVLFKAPIVTWLDSFLSGR